MRKNAKNHNNLKIWHKSNVSNHSVTTDYQEDLLLQMRMEQLMLQNVSESSDDEGGESDEQLVESEPELG